MTKKRNNAVIISFANRKGGVGKSSATMFVATSLHHIGYKVLVFDADNQRSILDTRVMDSHIYDDEIKDNTLYDVIGENSKSLLDETLLENVKSKYDYIFIDIPRFTDGQGDENLASILSLCDYVICPIRSGQLDNFSVSVLLNMLAEIKKYKESANSNLEFITFLSMCGRRPSHDQATLDYIEGLGHRSFANGLPDIVEFATPSTYKSPLKMDARTREKFIPFFKDFCAFVDISFQPYEQKTEHLMTDKVSK